MPKSYYQPKESREARTGTKQAITEVFVDITYKVVRIDTHGGVYGKETMRTETGKRPFPSSLFSPEEFIGHTEEYREGLRCGDRVTVKTYV
jgi:hypothetical protein